MKFASLKLFVLLFLFSCNVKSQNVVSADQFEAGMKNHPDHQLVDVRTPEEFGERHIPNAINNDYNDELFTERLKHLDKSKPVFVYCLSGGRSSSAQKLMKEMGFVTVYNLDGGIRSWEAKGKSVEQLTAPISGMTVNDFSKILKENKIVLVDFNAKWCPPCRKMAPYMEKLTHELAGEIKIIAADVDVNKELAQFYKVEALPLLMLFKNGEVVWNHSGFLNEEDLRKVLAGNID